MTMIPSGGAGSRDYDAFRERQVPGELRAAFDVFRKFCMSLGSDVLEDVRPHRVVFCKSMNMRWFADAKPADDQPIVVIKIRTGWRDPIRTIHMGPDGMTRDIRDAVESAYRKVR